MSNLYLIWLSYKNLGVKFFISFFLLGLTQVVFYVVNRGHFDLGSESFWMILAGNTLFITASCFVYLIPTLVLSAMPILGTRQSKACYISKRIASWFWVISTFIVIIFNMIDVFWYPIIKKRSSFSTLSIFLAVPSKWDFVWGIIKTYFIPAIIVILCFWGLVKLSRKFDKVFSQKSCKLPKYRWQIIPIVIEIILFILICYTSRICNRNKEYFHHSLNIKITDSVKFVSLKNTDLVLNTPFILMRNLRDKKKRLSKINFYSEEVLNSIFSIERHLPTSNDHLNEELSCIKNSGVKNVLILEVESLSAEYTATFNPPVSYTPFIDSLIKKSSTYLGWATGSHSMAAPLAINSSFPQYGGHSTHYFFNSSEFNTSLDSLSSRLKKAGFDTMFFFPDENGSMYLDTYAKQTEFDAYYGKNEYDKDYPGNSDFTGDIRGIWDEPFLQYAVEKTDETYHKNKKPFYSYVITAAAHWSWTVPEKYQSTFEKGPLEIHQPMRYSDYTISKFFEAASKKDWFTETLFIILADHTGASEGGYWAGPVGSHETPIIFYIPGSKCVFPVNKKMRISQVDIFPTVLDLFGIDSHIYSYGRSIFDPQHENLGISSTGTEHIFLKDNYLVLCYDNCSRIEVFDHKKDPMNTQNLMPVLNILSDKEKVKIEDTIIEAKASIQQFTNRLIEGKTSIQEEEEKETN